MTSDTLPLHDYGKLVLAALARAGHTDPVDVHRVLAVLIELRGWRGLRETTWGDLQAIVTEAHATAERDSNLWQARALGYFARVTWRAATPVRAAFADEALSDDTLEALVARNHFQPTGD